MSNYFDAVRAKDFEKALTFYAPQFFEKTSHVEWLQILKNVNSKLGDLRIYQLSGFRGQANAGAGLTGMFYILQYRVSHSKYPADETVTLFRPPGSDEMRILSHQIDSQGLLK